MKVLVAILNWNGQALLERFLPSVIEHSKGHQILIIDNNSTDNSRTWVEAHYPEIEWEQLDKNYGYAGGYNLGLQDRKEDIAVLLNSDVEVSANWIEPVRQAMIEDPQLCAAQPKILDASHRNRFEYAGACGGMMDKYGYPFCRGRIFDSLEEDRGQYQKSINVHWATGACLFFRLDQYQALEGLDVDLFAHMEEIDLCWRLRRQGKKVMCIPQSHVYHLGGGTLSGYKPFKSYLNFRNSLIIFIKNDHSGKTWSRLFFRMILDGLSILRFVYQLRFRHALAVAKAHFHFYAVLPSTLRKRKRLGNRHVNSYPRSIVFDYFLSRKKNYSDLVSE